jgi:uncharacterized protein with FMN-binding domain
VLAVYGAGFVKTRASAARFTDMPAMRRPAPALPSLPANGESGGQSAPAAVVAAPATVIVEPRHPVAPAPVAAAQATVTASPGASKPAAAGLAAPASGPTATAVSTAPAAVPDVPAALAPASASAAAATATPAAEQAQTTPVPSPALPLTGVPAAKTKYKDGTYLGYGTSRHGDIQAQVIIANDRIAAVSISKCLTQYSCDWLSPLPGQVVTRQSPETDYVSGATQSTNAFYYAVVEALSLARNQ